MAEKPIDIQNQTMYGRESRMDLTMDEMYGSVNELEQLILVLESHFESESGWNTLAIGASND